MTRSKNRWTPAGLVALVALGVVALFAVAPAAADGAGSVVNTVSDPVGDAKYSAQAFQDVVLVQMTKTASGDFEFLMEMAGPVPVSPPMPPPLNKLIGWSWGLDLDPTTFPAGYPYLKAYGPGEFAVFITWDGAEFAGVAIDRRPLLTGGEAIISPVDFSFDGTIVRADLPYTLIGAVPTSFGWSGGTGGWSGPFPSSEAHKFVDGAGAVFNP